MFNLGILFIEIQVGQMVVIDKRKENISKIEENLGESFVEMIRMSDALRLNFDEIIKDKISQ